MLRKYTDLLFLLSKKKKRQFFPFNVLHQKTPATTAVIFCQCFQRSFHMYSYPLRPSGHVHKSNSGLLCTLTLGHRQIRWMWVLTSRTGSLQSQSWLGLELKWTVFLWEYVQIVTRNGALVDIFSQQLARALGMVWAVSYKQYQKPTVELLCFSRPLVVALAVPLFLLMVVQWRWAEPAAKRCSTIGKAVYFRVPTWVLENNFTEVHRTGEPKGEQYHTMKRTKFCPCSWFQISA